MNQALLSQIQGGSGLKKTQTIDKSAPRIGHAAPSANAFKSSNPMDFGAELQKRLNHGSQPSKSPKSSSPSTNHRTNTQSTSKTSDNRETPVRSHEQYQHPNQTNHHSQQFHRKLPSPPSSPAYRRSRNDTSTKQQTIQNQGGMHQKQAGNPRKQASPADAGNTYYLYKDNGREFEYRMHENNWAHYEAEFGEPAANPSSPVSSDNDSEEFIPPPPPPPLDSEDEVVSAVVAPVEFSTHALSGYRSRAQILLNCLRMKNAHLAPGLFQSHESPLELKILGSLRSFSASLTPNATQDISKALMGYEIEALASAVKTYFKQHYPAHFPSECYHKLFKCCNSSTENVSKTAKRMYKVLKQMIKTNPTQMLDLKYLFQFLSGVQSVEPKMLAYTWGPCLIRPDEDSSSDIIEIMKQQKLVNHIVYVLIMKHNELLAIDYIERRIEKEEKLIKKEMARNAKKNKGKKLTSKVVFNGSGINQKPIVEQEKPRSKHDSSQEFRC